MFIQCSNCVCECVSSVKKKTKHRIMRSLLQANTIFVVVEWWSSLHVDVLLLNISVIFIFYPFIRQSMCLVVEREHILEYITVKSAHIWYIISCCYHFCMDFLSDNLNTAMYCFKRGVVKVKILLRVCWHLFPLYLPTFIKELHFLNQQVYNSKWLIVDPSRYLVAR